MSRLTRLYPDRADGWSLQLALDRSAGLPEEAAAVTASHREIFRDLQRRARDSGAVSARQAEALAAVEQQLAAALSESLERL